MEEKKHGWTVGITGEYMITRSFMHNTEPDFLKIKEIMESADVGYGHLEMNFGDYTDVYPSRGNWPGSFMLADPKFAKDIRWLGVDMMSTACNHTFDFGPAGVKSTIEALKDADIVCAGSGSSLGEARKPAFWDGAAGRVALIASASGNASSDWATAAKGEIKPRPGLNPIRIKMRYHVPEKDAEVVKKVGKELNILYEYQEGGKYDYLEQGEFVLETPSFLNASGMGALCIGEEYKVDSVCHPVDLEGNLRSIREAKELSDFVMVAHHASAADGDRGDEPVSSAVELAHAAIDAGADIFFGHGWHKTLGVEIYKGKPIFYGLGNFFMQSVFLRQIAYDCMEARGISTTDVVVAKPSEDPHPGVLPLHRSLSLTTAVMVAEFDEDKQVKAISFYPVEMGVDLEQEDAPVNRMTGKKYHEGRPVMVHGKGAQIVLERLKKLSAPFGTEIKIQGDVGRWDAETIT